MASADRPEMMSPKFVSLIFLVLRQFGLSDTNIQGNWYENVEPKRSIIFQLVSKIIEDVIKSLVP